MCYTAIDDISVPHPPPSCPEWNRCGNSLKRGESHIGMLAACVIALHAAAAELHLGYPGLLQYSTHDIY